MSLPPNPHDAKIRSAWRLCRYGAARIREAEPRERVLRWIESFQERFPGSPYLEAWARIVRGDDPEAAAELADETDYLALPEERRGWWRPLVQSQPFACILPGRTTRERREFLSRLA